MKLKVKDEFDIIGRGKVFTLNTEDNGIHPKELKIGMLVTIRDLEYRIRGIESFLQAYNDTSKDIAINVTRYYKPL